MKQFFLVLILSTCLALGYVQQRVWLITLGYQVERLVAQRDDFLDQHRVLVYNVLALQSPVILDERLAQRDVQLTPPKAVEVLPPRLEMSPPAQMWSGAPQPESSWWKQAWKQGRV